jgi:glutathione S-transferase
MGLFGKKEAKKPRMQLRGFPGDVNTTKCLLMASEKNVQLDVELLDVLDGACDRQDYRDISPFGKCPCLKEDDFLTTGAPAVLAYLDVRGKSPGGLMNPKKAAIFGHQNYWIQIATEIAEPAVAELVEEKICGPMSDSDYSEDAARCAMARETLEQVLDELNSQLDGKQLDGRKFIVSDYCYVDIYWTAIAHLCSLMGEQDLIDSRNHVKTWYERVQARDSFANLPTLDDIKQKQLRSVA